MKTVPVRTYYLETRTPPSSPVAPARPDLGVRRVPAPQAPWYRSLYNKVGESWRWLDRARMSDEQLAPLIQHPEVEIYTLFAGKAEAGFAELDRRKDDEVELLYFGLVPEYTGQKLGRYFLDHVLILAWQHRPRRVWLHTCEWDHPAALPMYRKAGFVQYDEKWIDQVIPDDVPEPLPVRPTLA